MGAADRGVAVAGGAGCAARDAKHVPTGGPFAAQDAAMIGGGEIDAAARITTKAPM